MVLQIFYYEDGTNRRKVLFDIEFYQTYDTKDGEKFWYSEIRTLPIASNIVDYVLKNNNFSSEKWSEFKQYSESIAFLRGWIYEVENNRPLESKEADERHYKKFLPKIKELVNNFAKDFELCVNTD